MLDILQILLCTHYMITCYQLEKIYSNIHLLCCLSITNHILATLTTLTIYLHKNSQELCSLIGTFVYKVLGNL